MMDAKVVDQLTSWMIAAAVGVALDRLWLRWRRRFWRDHGCSPSESARRWAARVLASAAERLRTAVTWRRRQAASEVNAEPPGALAVPAWLHAAAVRLRVAVTGRAAALELALFVGSLGVYLATRLIDLTQFPIYFFTDEAVHTVLAEAFVKSGLHNYDHEFLPTYFSLGPSFGLNGVSVYLQVLPYLLFGKSEFVTRAVSVLVSCLAAAAVGLILRDFFKTRYWWAATLLLSVTPAWFLHSRTAFEYVEAAAFYAGFLYFYLRYRCRSPRSLYAAIVLGALTFYTHGLGQVLMGVTGAALLLADWRYHWQKRAVALRGLAVLVVAAAPYVRYTVAHSNVTGAQIRQRNSYWADSRLSVVEKTARFSSEYLYGLSPTFWCSPENRRDIDRHVMKGYGNIWWPTLPLLIGGLILAVRRWREPPSRTVLLALVASPVGSALVAIGIPRMLWCLIPMTVLSGLGLAWGLERLERWARPTALAAGVFTALAGFNFYMLADALVNGPRWFTDYSLYGMQYGARQLFAEAIPAALRRYLATQVIVSPSWANGTDQLLDFFLDPQQRNRVKMGSVDTWLARKTALSPDMLFVMIPGEYQRAQASGKFKPFTVEQTLPYPDGTPGFYLVRLAYVDDVDAVFAAEAAERLKPVVETIALGDQTVTVSHPQFGSGRLNDMLDGNPDTLVTTPDVNPAVFDFTFSAPRPVGVLTVTTGSMPDFSVNVRLYAPGVSEPVSHAETYRGLPPDPTVVVNLPDAPPKVERLHLEIFDRLSPAVGSNIHVREVQFR